MAGSVCQVQQKQLTSCLEQRNNDARPRKLCVCVCNPGSYAGNQSNAVDQLTIYLNLCLTFSYRHSYQAIQ